MKLFLGILTVYQKKGKEYFLECKTIQYPNKVKFIIKNKIYKNKKLPHKQRRKDNPERSENESKLTEKWDT